MIWETRTFDPETASPELWARMHETGRPTLSMKSSEPDSRAFIEHAS